MFTGLITHTAVVDFYQNEQLALTIEGERPSIFVGQSIAVSGCCLTVTKVEEKTIFFDINQETKNVTNIATWNKGMVVNIEFSATFGQTMDGHYVSGHVDGLATIDQIQSNENSYDLSLTFDSSFQKYVVEKGSIAIDGISLTVNEVSNNHCTVCIIPHTWRETNLSKKQVGDKVHVEFDMMAKYFIKQLQPYMDKIQRIES